MIEISRANKIHAVPWAGMIRSYAWTRQSYQNITLDSGTRQQLQNDIILAKSMTLMEMPTGNPHIPVILFFLN
jgi:hypothetical protein